jgi:predicted nucleic acid-binding protein
LAKLFGLSDFERDILLLCAAMELDPALPQLCAQVRENQGRPYPTFALALVLLDDPGWDALAATRPLRYLRLLEINQPGATPLTASALRVDEHILNHIKGLLLLDDRLLALGFPVTAEALLSAGQAVVVESVLQRIRGYGGVQPAVQLAGDGDSALAVAAHVCAGLNHQLFRIEAAALPAQAGELETLLRLWQRESRLLRLALYLDLDAAEPAAPETLAAQRLLEKQPGLVFVGVRQTPLSLRIPGFVVEVERPAAVEQHAAWSELLAPLLGESGADRAARRLASQFDLNLGQIEDAVQKVQGEGTASAELSRRLWDRCRELTRPRLDALAQRLEPKAGWDDLVVPEEAGHILQQIASQVQERHRVYGEWGFGLKMNRGFGIAVLFAGDSGTGKTMAAEVIARELRLNLYRIDLSAVVSKYIGETEKNLRRLFDAAEQGGAILFFDEADALFGKRSEVKDSHDRYANIEINYLLQRMESFRGLAILASNMKSALDPAFLRRLRFVVDFPFPGTRERKRIWENAFPRPDRMAGSAGAPLDGLNYDQLAKLNLSGGNIHNIAINAAFLAAQHGSKVTMPLVLQAAGNELRKLDRPVSEADFRSVWPAGGRQ